MKKGLFILIIFLVAGALYFIFGSGSKSLIGDDVVLYSYALGEEQTGGGTLSIPFLDESNEGLFINVQLDVNGDGAFQDEEWVVQNQVAHPFADYRNNFFVDLASFDEALGARNTRILLSASDVGGAWDGTLPEGGEILDTQAQLETFDATDILGLDVPGASIDLKRGAFAMSSIAPLAHAQSATGGVFRTPPVPDLPQGNMECMPVSTTNNLISLAQEHGRRDDLPQNPRDIVEELKNDMKYHDGSLGVLLKDMIPGKNAFAERYNLPIVSERINNPTATQLSSALSRGCVAELSMGFIRSRSGRPDTGHVVSLVGVGANGSSVQVHDPATPGGGADTYQLPFKARAGNTEYQGINYPMWDGIAIIDAVIIQCWTGTEQATTGTQIDGQATSKIETLVIGGSYYPKSQFRAAEPDRCKNSHWHGPKVYGLKTKTSKDIVSTTDPAPNACGFGVIGEVPEEFIDITFEQSQELIKHLPI